MRGPVEFVVQHLEVQDGWALVWAHPRRPGGGQIDPEAVLPPEQLEFTSSIRVDALLQMRGGGWNLEGYRIGATDVWYACFPRAPATLTDCEDDGAESPAGSFGNFPADFPGSDWMSNSAACYLYLMISADTVGGRTPYSPAAMQQAAGQWRARLRQALSEQEVQQFTASETNFRLQPPPQSATPLRSGVWNTRPDRAEQIRRQYGSEFSMTSCPIKLQLPGKRA